MFCYVSFCLPSTQFFFFFFNDTATTEIYTLSLHDALPICAIADKYAKFYGMDVDPERNVTVCCGSTETIDRKSTRLNSSHGYISYAVFCLKKKKQHRQPYSLPLIASHPVQTVRRSLQLPHG